MDPGPLPPPLTLKVFQGGSQPSTDQLQDMGGLWNTAVHYRPDDQSLNATGAHADYRLPRVALRSWTDQIAEEGKRSNLYEVADLVPD